MYGQYIAAINAEIQRNARKGMAFHPSKRRLEQKEAVINWVEGWESNFDLDVCFHVPKEMRVIQNGNGHEWLQKQLSAYFNIVEKELFKSIPVRQRQKLSRFIVLEHANSVGWHAHALIATPDNCKQAQVCDVMRDIWERRVGQYCKDEFRQRLFWIRKSEFGYLNYCLKYVIENNDNANAVNKGIIDLENTSRN